MESTQSTAQTSAQSPGIRGFREAQVPQTMPPQGRLKILMGAYQCGPTGGPEAGAGWAFATAAAAEHDVWVICRKRFVPSIEHELSTRPDLTAHLRVVPLDPPGWVVRFLRRPFDIYWFYPLWQVLLSRTARRLHKEVGFDVAHHVTFANDWMPCGLTALNDVPLIWGPVGGASQAPFWRLREWLGVRGVVTELVRETLLRVPRRLWGDSAARHAHLVVAQNAEVAHRFRRSSNVTVEPNAALDLAALPNRLPRTGDGRGRTAIFVGRLIPLKGATLALQAIARSDLAGWHLDVYGDGPLRASLEGQARRLGVANRVAFHGHRDRLEVLEAMAAADVMLFPSMHDQAGWAVAEASSIGLPVVCLPLGGPPVLADQNAFPVSLDEDLVGAVCAQMVRAAASEGQPHRRWSVDRLPAIVKGWYADAHSVSHQRVEGPTTAW
ncbi:glycosyltransferase family 4 protein [Nocardioides terrae]|nr:glycosyltransferase [Nocardioides terrae]